MKNKCAAPFTEAEFDIRWGIGIDWAADLVEVATSCGVIDKSGSHLSFAGKSIGQGRDRARDAVFTNPELRAAIERETLEALPSQVYRLKRRSAA